MADSHQYESSLMTSWTGKKTKARRMTRRQARVMITVLTMNQAEMDGPVLVAAHRYRPQPPPLKVLVLEKHHLGQTPGGSWEQEVEESLSFRNATIKALFGKHCFLVDLVI